MSCAVSLPGRRSAACFRVFGLRAFPVLGESGFMVSEAHTPSKQSASYFQYRYPSPRRSVRKTSNGPSVFADFGRAIASNAEKTGFDLAYQAQKTPLGGQANNAPPIRGNGKWKRNSGLFLSQLFLGFRHAQKAAILIARLSAGLPDAPQARSFRTANACQAQPLVPLLARWLTTSDQSGLTAQTQLSTRTAPALAGAVFLFRRLMRGRRGDV